MRVALAQLNQTVGDFDGNASRIIDAAKQAAADGARVLLTPELSVAGYPPEDLLLRRGFYVRCDDAMATIRQETASLDLHIVVGLPLMRGELRYNAAQVLYRGEVVGEYHKHDLPNYAVFDEQRYFEPDSTPLVFDVDGLRFGVVICEDFWFAHAPESASAAGAQVLLALNASPYHMDKQHTRLDVARENVTRFGMPILAANLVGGQDELVFDGKSFVLYAAGELVAQARTFETELLTVDINSSAQGVSLSGGRIEPTLDLEAQVYGALVLGVRDYLGKIGFPGAVLGLSGGIDSALTLAVAVDALGAENVRAVMMPSRYTSDMSLEDAKDMAQRLGVRYDVIPIRDMFESMTSRACPRMPPRRTSRPGYVASC
jgi:NAD+ synthase (glutamine-hydrolysing)